MRTFSLLVMMVGIFSGCAASAGADAAADGGPVDGAAADGASAPMVLVGGANSDGSGFVDWSSTTPRPAIITGIQGGQHVFVSVRTRNIFPTQAKITAMVAAPETCEPNAPGPATWKVSLKKDGDWLTYQGITAFVGEPCAIKDKWVRVKVEVTDQNGVTATGHADIQPTWSGACP